jgi:hypothetical protein
MTKDQAITLRQVWATKGNPSCVHPTLKLLRTKDDYLTGDYVCDQCGAQVGKVQTLSLETVS